MDNFKKAFGVLLHPGKETKRSMGIGDALKFYYSVMIIPMIIGIIFGAVMGVISPGLMAVSIVGVIIYYLIMFPLSILVNAGIYHVIIGKLFKMYKGKYDKVVSAFTYAIMPMVLVYWIILPITGGATALNSGSVLGSAATIGAAFAFGLVLAIIFGIWSFVVMVMGLSNQLNMSRLKAFGTLILEGVIVGIIYIVVLLATGL